MENKSRGVISLVVLSFLGVAFGAVDVVTPDKDSDVNTYRFQTRYDYVKSPSYSDTDASVDSDRFTTDVASSLELPPLPSGKCCAFSLKLKNKESLGNIIVISTLVYENQEGKGTQDPLTLGRLRITKLNTVLKYDWGLPKTRYHLDFFYIIGSNEDTGEEILRPIIDWQEYFDIKYSTPVTVLNGQILKISAEPLNLWQAVNRFKGLSKVALGSALAVGAAGLGAYGLYRAKKRSGQGSSAVVQDDTEVQDFNAGANNLGSDSNAQGVGVDFGSNDTGPGLQGLPETQEQRNLKKLQGLMQKYKGHPLTINNNNDQ